MGVKYFDGYLHGIYGISRHVPFALYDDAGNPVGNFTWVAGNTRISHYSGSVWVTTNTTNVPLWVDGYTHMVTLTATEMALGDSSMPLVIYMTPVPGLMAYATVIIDRTVQNSNMTQINGDDTDGYNAHLKLLKLEVNNQSGTAVNITSNDGAAVSLSSNNAAVVVNSSTSDAVDIQGGGSGAGIIINSGATGIGVKITSPGSDGVSIDGQTGVGVRIKSTGVNQNGMTVTGVGTGHGIEIIKGGGLDSKDIDADEALNLQQTRDSMKLAPSAGVPATDSIDDKIDNIQAGSGLNAQQTRDSMKLAPSAGVPATDSIDDKIDNISAGSGLDAQATRNAMQLDATGTTIAGSIDDQLSTINIDVNAIDPLTSQQTRDSMLLDGSGAGLAGSIDDQLSNINTNVGSITTLTDQQIRDSMKLSPSAGGALQSSIDEKLNNINPLSAQQTRDSMLLNKVGVVVAGSIDDQLSVINTDVNAINPLTAQQTRDSMALNVATGVSAGSVDEKLNVLSVDVNAINPLTEQQTRDSMLLTPTPGVPDPDSIDEKINEVASNMITAFPTIDGIPYTVMLEYVMAMSNGRMKIDQPTPGFTTYYKRDSTTPLFVVETTPTERKRV